MFENPGDELYFGEVYRQILQEAWLPGGGETWSVVGKSRRGYRPSQRGITGPNVSPSQEEVRRWFSKCAAAWRDLPWELPPDPSCDNRNDRKYWKDEKDARGLMCSYYDLYMRYCLRFALDTGCIPPANYLLKVEGDLSAIECNKVYDLNFPNKCGDVSMVSGEGQFVAPGEWVSPKCGTEGDLCFKDENGSFGPISYKFTPLHWCTEFIWPVYNPSDIDPNVSKPVYVEGGIPPYTWSCEGEDMSLSDSITDEPVNSLHAGPGACGTAHINVKDICGNEITGYVMCSVGQWVLKGHYCGLPGSVPWYDRSPSPLSWMAYEYISGHRKQHQVTSVYRSHKVNCDEECCPPACAAWYAENPCPDQTPNCIDGDHNGIPGLDYCKTDGWDCEYGAACISSLDYYEWEC